MDFKLAKLTIPIDDPELLRQWRSAGPRVKGFIVQFALRILSTNEEVELNNLAASILKHRIGDNREKFLRAFVDLIDQYEVKHDTEEKNEKSD